MLNSKELYQLAFDFFQTFARVEYALKASGHFRTTTELKDGLPKTIDAEANWVLFGSKITILGLTSQSKEVENAVNFIFDFPPLKQVVKGNRILTWEDCRPTGDANPNNLFTYIKRVRNNLFHGGKFNVDWMAPERSEKLMLASLTVLKAAVLIVPEVEKEFNN